MTPGVTRGAAAVGEVIGGHERAFPARPEQVAEARRFVRGLLAGCPVADDAVLCVSELAGNCVTHSASGQLGAVFTVRADVHDGEYVWLEVADGGGVWGEVERDGRPHGLDIIGALASESGVAGCARTGWVVWARIDWPLPG
ncbi:MAG TPA: ATP-binding protein [Streptosporangiaceae bacterium]|nr:ATP-binding protein [Streptosporangiaceae bacterium]